MRDKFGVYLAELELKLDNLLDTFEKDFDVKITHIVLYRDNNMRIMSNIITKLINEPFIYQKNTGVIIMEQEPQKIINPDHTADWYMKDFTDINEGNF